MEIPSLLPDKTILLDLVKMRMPFGKYKGTILADLPISYLEWFARKGFPDGRLGVLLETIYVIKSNGLMRILDPIRNFKQ
jgi:uncharacterized protein